MSLILQLVFNTPGDTYSVVGEQSSILVQYKPPVLPPVHHVRPFGQRTLHKAL